MQLAFLRTGNYVTSIAADEFDEFTASFLFNTIFFTVHERVKIFSEMCLWQNPSSGKHTCWTNLVNQIESQHEDKLRKSTTYGGLRFASI